MKLLVSGYFGFQNAGDEAILAAMIQHLKEIVPDAGITVLSRAPALTERTHGVRAVRRTGLGQIAGELAGADLFISGGGGLLQDVTSSRSVPYYLGLVAMAKFMGKPVFFYSQGVGPLRLRASRLLVRLVANRADAITVRDAASRDVLESLGVTRPPVHVTADPAFGLALQPSVRRGRDILTSEGVPVNAGPLVAVSVRPWAAMPGHLEAVARAADEAVRSFGATVVYVPFYKPGDAVVSRAGSELMRERSYVLKGDYSPQEIMSIIRDVDIVIGMRYHSLVFAVASATPFVAVSYDPKIEGLLETVGERAGLSHNEVDGEALVGRVRDVWARREEMKAALARVAPVLSRQAREAARLAVETARGGGAGRGRG
ncbi:MAG: polysaccharide pyruvyl transferase CsaB [Bacillota bacterium]